MKTELQNKAWNCLPREFREKVKYEWRHTDDGTDVERVLTEIFGYHNLTSDAEGEEMLTVKASTVREMYAANDRLIADFSGTKIETDADVANNTLRDLFGSKCLPDAHEDNFASKEPKPHGDNPSPEPKPADDDDFNVPEPKCKHFKDGKCAHPAYSGHDCDVSSCEDVEYKPKPAEPKFKRGDMVIYKRTGKKKVIFGMDKYGRYMVALPNMQSPMYVDESDLEPCTEPTLKPSNSGELKSQDADKQSVTILKNSCDHNRLHIAAMCLQGLLANSEHYKVNTIADWFSGESAECPYKRVAGRALKFADALIKEAEKGGET